MNEFIAPLGRAAHKYVTTWAYRQILDVQRNDPLPSGLKHSVAVLMPGFQKALALLKHNHVLS